MTIDKEKLKDLAGQSALEPRWYEAGSHGLKNVSHLHDREFIAAASPATVLALLAEIERLVAFEEAYATACNVRNRLIKENEAMRDGANFRAIQSLRADCEALRKDAERYRFVRSPLGTSSPLAIWNEGKMPLFSSMADAVVDEFMAKEASHG